MPERIMGTVKSDAEREIVLSRVFDAPRKMVWEAWTDPKQVAQWWGPNGFSTTIEEMDVRPGGVWRLTMHGPDGTDYSCRIQYREIVPSARLAYRHGSDVDNDPNVFEVVITFAAAGAGQTLLKTQSTFSSIEARNAVMKFGAVELGIQTYEKLAVYLESVGV